ncbi:DUF1292 domain-containing protein [Alkaliphilus transvaalensis]|uniref:DUF1292 domain-containing protein n=1 Tax=Alkaliphilus transvaalensis TaxID=114628 RepID=UPI000479CA41|nr:DUF1292 domain-containing protein [Alkaliphilus transvaalensis]
MENNHNHQHCGHHHDHDHHHPDHDCCCGHDHHHEHQTIKLLLDDDRELDCTVLEIFQVEEQEYIALLPEGEENVLIYRFNEEEEGPQLANIEDEEEFQTVSDVFLEMMQQGEEEEEITEE